jgi:hypothetical protein
MARDGLRLGFCAIKKADLRRLFCHASKAYCATGAAAGAEAASAAAGAEAATSAAGAAVSAAFSPQADRDRANRAAIRAELFILFYFLKITVSNQVKVH